MIIKQILAFIFFLAFSKADTIKIQLKKQDAIVSNSSKLNSNSFLDESNSRQLQSSSSQKSVDLTNFLKHQYTAEISIGKGSQKLQVLVDTSSSKLMIPSQDCITNKNCKGFSKYYDCASSDGCAVTKKYETQDYLTGNVNGLNVNATVGIANLTQIQQSILLFDKSNQFTNEFSEGLLGLSVYNMDNDNGNSFVTNLYQNRLIPNNMFSLYLGYKLDDSELVLGGYNAKKINSSSPIYNHKISQNFQKDDTQQWVITVKSTQLNTFSQKLSSTKNQALIDSSYPYLGVEKNIYQSMVNYFLSQGGKLVSNQYQIECNKTLDDIQLSILDSDYTERIYSLPFSFYTSNSSNTCTFLIQSYDENNNISFIFGTPFLRRYVSIFYNSNLTNFSTIYQYSIFIIIQGFAQSIANPNDDYTSGLPAWAIALIAVAASIVSLVGGFGIYKKCKAKSNSNGINQSLYSNTSI